MSTNIVYFLRLRVAGIYASLTKSNKKRKLQSKRKGAKNIVLTKTYLKPKAVLARPENSPQETNPDRNQRVNHKLASANVYRLQSLSILAKSNPRNNNRSSYLVISFVNFCPTNHTIKCTQKMLRTKMKLPTTRKKAKNICSWQQDLSETP